MKRIELYGVVGWDFTAADVVAQLEGADDVQININSGGGQVTEAAAIYNRLSAHEGNVAVVVDGLAASAATIIAMAGDSITMPENGTFMVHSPWIAVSGTSKELQKAARRLEATEDQMVAAYAKRTGLSEAEVSALMKEETWMTAGEAMSFGFIDGIAGAEPEVEQSARQAAMAYLDVSVGREWLPAYLHAPQWARLRGGNQAPEGAALSGDVMSDTQGTDAAPDRIAELEAENQRLREQVEQFEAAREEREDADLRAEVERAGVTENVDKLVALAKADRDLFDTTIKALTAKPQVQDAIGQTGDADVSGESTVEDILAEAKEAGVSYGNGLTQWLAKNHPSKITEVVAACR